MKMNDKKIDKKIDKKLELKKEYPYLYETHLHTSQSSACARSSGAEMAKACKEAGYTGIIVTDHNWGGNSAIGRGKPWKEWVNDFAKGYEDAKRVGDQIGLDVFFGYEAGFDGTEFLIYGLDKEYMIGHPQLRDASVEEQYALVQEAKGMVIHAHPFREEFYIPQIRLYPEYVDAVEGINATHSNKRSMSHRNPAFDESAIAYARKHNLPISAGSDIHTTTLLGAGVAFKRRLTDIYDFIEAMRSGEDYILTNGDTWFKKNGELY